jgi:hypothetical protein
VTGLPWSPATDGLRNITGKLVEDQDFPFGFPFGFGLDRGHASGHAMVALYAISSTISGNGDPGADPNRLYVIYDDLANTDPTVAAKESFQVLRSAEFGEVLRGVSFTPGTENISSF